MFCIFLAEEQTRHDGSMDLFSHMEKESTGLLLITKGAWERVLKSITYPSSLPPHIIFTQPG